MSGNKTKANGAPTGGKGKSGKNKAEKAAASVDTNVNAAEQQQSSENEGGSGSTEEEGDAPLALAAEGNQENLDENVNDSEENGGGVTAEGNENEAEEEEELIPTLKLGKKKPPMGTRSGFGTGRTRTGGANCGVIATASYHNVTNFYQAVVNNRYVPLYPGLRGNPTPFADSMTKDEIAAATKEKTYFYPAGTEKYTSAAEAFAANPELVTFGSIPAKLNKHLKGEKKGQPIVDEIGYVQNHKQEEGYQAQTGMKEDGITPDFNKYGCFFTINSMEQAELFKARIDAFLAQPWNAKYAGMVTYTENITPMSSKSTWEAVPNPYYVAPAPAVAAEPAAPAADASTTATEKAAETIEA